MTVSISNIIHWFIPNISPGYASFLMSTNGLIHSYISKGINISISYKKHPLQFIMEHNDEIDCNFNTTFFENSIHIIHKPIQLELLIQKLNQNIIHICCVYAYEKICFETISYKCYLKSIAFPIKSKYICCINDFIKQFELTENNSFTILHIRMHDKYLNNRYMIPSRKIKYIEKCIEKFIDENKPIKTIVLSNSVYIKKYLSKKYTLPYIHLSDFEYNYHSSELNMQMQTYKNILFNTFFDFYIIQNANAVYSIPLIYSKKTHTLHGGNFSHFACQLYDKPYHLLDTLSIYCMYHDVESESMESLEN
jgi:hypothetical protein